MHAKDDCCHFQPALTPAYCDASASCHAFCLELGEACHGFFLEFSASCYALRANKQRKINEGNAARPAQYIPERPFKVPIPSPMMTDL